MIQVRISEVKISDSIAPHFSTGQRSFKEFFDFSQTLFWAKAQFYIYNIIPVLKDGAIEILNLMKLHGEVFKAGQSAGA